jgi:glycosyltransferase involved in cell wall biosynthesis
MHGELMRHNRYNIPSIGFVSTYPPTSCGLATFTFALRGAIAGGRGSEVGLDVVSLVEDRLEKPRPEVVYQHLNGDGVSLEGAVEALNTRDVALFQHEYGIFGRPDGAEILDMVSNLDIPTVVTLHTVLSNPTSRQQKILERIVDLTEQTIVMSDTALRRLIRRYELDAKKVRVVPHGAMARLAGPRLARGTRPVVLTWGLIGPGKGLETAIEAFAALKDLRPLPRYIILGKTHPKVQAAQGDAYLEGLMDRAHSLGLDDVVEFDGRYLDIDSLTLEIGQADIVLLPYESMEQVTSGVLVEAIAAGKPVIATAFPHAIEMLGTGAGAVVPHSDPGAMAGALRSLLTDPGLTTRMANMASSIGPTLYWPAVADKYESIASGLVARPLPVAALTGSRHRQSPADDLARVG